ncbi:uncharacterized protein [Dendrobates tinctorius]|uniref:uncharacterized protein n=1 Tax=Dendrobates tinctorius TaxID=92724 RepID=UPI003CCA3DA3
MIQDNKINTTLHQKSTATNNFLHYKSFHPAHLRNGIPKGQFLRLRRNCSRLEDFQKESRALTERFLERGYPRNTVSRAYQYSRNCMREDTLRPRVRTNPSTINLITKFNNQWGDIYRILNNNWDILCSENKLKNFISERPRMIARRATNLKDYLTNSHFRRSKTKIRCGNSNKGSFPCGNCTVCPLMIATRGLSIPGIPIQVQSRAYFNCRSRNLVYALVCGCNKVYVGQTTQELRRRVQQHLSNIATARVDKTKEKQITSVAAHFLECHGGSPKSLRVMGLEGVQTSIRGGKITNELLRREARWIFELKSLAPGGLNEELLYTGFYKES